MCTEVSPQCCNAMLKKWLEVDPFATWEKLFIVIESPAVCSDQASDNRNQCFYSILHYCVAMCCLQGPPQLTWTDQPSLIKV